MTHIRWRLVSGLRGKYSDLFGSDMVGHICVHITKVVWIELGFAKSHENEAFVIAGGGNHFRHCLFQGVQRRNNKRSLESFYDARHTDVRDGKIKSGKEVASRRRTRSRENSRRILAIPQPCYLDSLLFSSTLQV